MESVHKKKSKTNFSDISNKKSHVLSQGFDQTTSTRYAKHTAHVKKIGQDGDKQTRDKTDQKDDGHRNQSDLSQKI